MASLDCFLRRAKAKKSDASFLFPRRKLWENRSSFLDDGALSTRAHRRTARTRRSGAAEFLPGGGAHAFGRRGSTVLRKSLLTHMFDLGAQRAGLVGSVVQLGEANCLVQQRQDRQVCGAGVFVAGLDVRPRIRASIDDPCRARQA